MPPLRITTNNEKSKSPKPVDLKTLKQSKNVCVCMRVYARVRMPTKKKKTWSLFCVAQVHPSMGPALECD